MKLISKISFLAVLVIGVSVNAYELLTSSWTSNDVEFYIGFGGSEDNISAADYQSALNNAMTSWGDNSNFQYNPISAYKDPCGINILDLYSSVRFSSDICGTDFGDTTLAIASGWSAGTTKASAYIVFNSSRTWGIHDNSTNSPIDFKRVALHEVGHTLGIGHEETNSAIMNPTYSNSVKTLQTDDINAIRAIYGLDNSTDDHGDDTSTATAISFNTDVSGNIRGDGDDDYFSIHVPVGGGDLDIYSTGITNTYGYLLDSSGNVIAEHNNISTINGNFNIRQTLSAGTYYIRVKGYFLSTTGDYTLRADITNTIPAPSGVSASDGSYTSYVEVSWSDVSNASSYTVYRSNGSEGVYSQIASTSSSPYDDSSAAEGIIYSYKVKACENSSGTDRCGDYSYSDSGYRALVAPAAPSATVQSANQINLSWPSVSVATYYLLYNDGIQIYGGSNLSYSHTGLSSGTNYSYTLKACINNDISTCSEASAAVHRVAVTKWTLSTSASDGIVTATGIDCGTDCSQSYNENTQIQLTANANDGYTFTHWSDCSSSSDNPLTIVMDSDKSCDAHFIEIDTDTDGTPDAIDIDDDNDGIPDSFEANNGLNSLDASDANGDSDGDGFSNLEEYNAGTNLNNSNDSPNSYIDYSTIYNQYGGVFNAPNTASSAFAALKADGSITAWGEFSDDAPTDSGYVKVHPSSSAFAALKADGSITAWGDSSVNAPTDSGYANIYSTVQAFAALKADGSITVWGETDYGGSGAPTDSGYVKIYSNDVAFAALKADGSITAWGGSFASGTEAPTDSGYVKIYSIAKAFAALKADGSITAWGGGDTGAPVDSGYINIYSTENAFAALKADGSITAWGGSDHGGSGAPTGTGYVKVHSTASAFAALKADGSITAWGGSDHGGSGAPTDSGYVKVYSTASAFAALKADGSINAWGGSGHGGSGSPTDSGYVKVYSTASAFAALKTDGSITAWGGSDHGGSGAPTDSDYVEIYSTVSAFAALKADGSITAWGGSSHGGSGAPTDSGYQFNDITTPFAPTFSLDVDGNGVLTASNDGLIIFKYLSNPNANNLHTTIRADAADDRKTSEELKAYLDAAIDILDVDGDGVLSAPNDGLIIFKYLLNSNANNLHTTISPGAIDGRKTTKELKTYLDAYR